MLKPAGHEAVQHAFARMAKGRMAQVMPERDRFRQVFIQPKPARNGPRDLADLQRMRKARAVMVPDRGKKNLRFVFQAPEGFAVNDPVPVAHKLCADGAFFHRVFPSACVF